MAAGSGHGEVGTPRHRAGHRPGELVLTPDPVELHTNRCHTDPRNVVALLSELGERGRRLVAVHGEDSWPARPAPEPEPGTSVPPGVR